MRVYVCMCMHTSICVRYVYVCAYVVFMHIMFTYHLHTFTKISTLCFTPSPKLALQMRTSGPAPQPCNQYVRRCLHVGRQ